MISQNDTDIFSSRRAGVLLHPTCIKGPEGVLGGHARAFVDFLAEAGITVWQTLPLGPTHSDLSPYQSLSAHAGNADLIDVAELEAMGLLQASELDTGLESHGREALLARAITRFLQGDAPQFDADFEAFRQENRYWLDTYAEFIAIRRKYPGTTWQQWPVGLRDRERAEMDALSREASDMIRRVQFEQFLFLTQWRAIKRYAHDRGVLLFGDIPIFVAHDSADVWANRRCFKLDNEGNPQVVAGVPPDYFSDEGQHWGNPLYDWDYIAADGYQWWLQRLESQRHLFDLIRIDHFRGLSAYWEIPADRPQPRNGYWVPGPGAAFLDACFAKFPDLPLVAENLGIIGPEVEELRHRFRLPGMTVLQFGFDGSPDNPHLLGNHKQRDLVYTGTHDNDTTLGWYQSLDDRSRDYVNQYFDTDGRDMPWPLIKAAFRSVSSIALVPMQDFLGLGSSARFNTPGTTENNWLWKLDLADCTPDLSLKIREMLQISNRTF
ncbi:4-alpha-glucanotransferase (amylomaltase) [Marinobacter nitratireducens]|uniref:4-alpha-glucanotransferase n=1 Tax=Marinobacter nitratireducens TaxID=1137280 RepID=A0A072N618_9GAMM|nr:4-alpha-glucanotransferase [Marinobacter nitratireducens]KEF32423.1 4-alpha-glucanotransferase (amylomaltase) [Marinobacter nitratireducens]